MKLHVPAISTALAAITFTILFTLASCSALEPDDAAAISEAVGVAGKLAVTSVTTGGSSLGPGAVSGIVLAINLATTLANNANERRLARKAAERGEHPLQLAGVKTPLPTNGPES
tara:strand:- start:4429 stop:4773 length:345 start_codon:yes stop_codon:yes gene_type:complete